MPTCLRWSRASGPSQTLWARCREERGIRASLKALGCCDWWLLWYCYFKSQARARCWGRGHAAMCQSVSFVWIVQRGGGRSSFLSPCVLREHEVFEQIQYIFCTSPFSPLFYHCRPGLSYESHVLVCLHQKPLPPLPYLLPPVPLRPPLPHAFELPSTHVHTLQRALISPKARHTDGSPDLCLGQTKTIIRHACLYEGELSWFVPSGVAGTASKPAATPPARPPATALCRRRAAGRLGGGEDAWWSMVKTADAL